jgi:PKD repeat protein
VYAFEYGTDTWTQTAKLVATDGDAEDGFGTSISVSADGATALVGTLDDEDPNGSAYVFERSGGAWTQAANFVAADGDSQDGFGATVALSADGTTGLVGAAGDDDPNGLNAGSAYVFDRAGGAWTQRVKLAADDGDNQDQFGRAVSVSADGTTGLVGAMGDEGPSGGADAGSAYVFELAALDGPAVDGRPARDADGDGRYEDVDGDGRQSFDDVVTLFESLDAPSVESNPDAFDFNRNGRLDFDDLLALFRSISG